MSVSIGLRLVFGFLPDSSGYGSDSLAVSTRCFPCVQFADVTNAGFPPVYEKFLAVIGMFSMDLGWVLSASCLATSITFYDKLL